MRRAGRCTDALTHYAQVFTITPGHAQAHLYHAVCYLTLGEDGRARALLESIHEVFPLHRDVRDALVRVLAASSVDSVRDAPLALTLIEKPVSEVDVVETDEARAMIYAELGRFDEAIQWQETAIARAQGQAAYLAHLTTVLQHYRERHPSRTPWVSLYDDE